MVVLVDVFRVIPPLLHHLVDVKRSIRYLLYWFLNDLPLSVSCDVGLGVLDIWFACAGSSPEGVLRRVI